MRAFAIVLVAWFSACAPADPSDRAGGGSARADVPARLRADTAAAVSAAPFRRGPAEPADSFAARSGPGGELVHPVIATDAWSPGDTALIAYYQHPADIPSSEPGAFPVHEAMGYAFFPDSARVYRRVEIGLIGQEGGEPEIRSVFLANADTVPGPELVVMAAWSIHNYFTSGTLYGTHVYALRRERGADRFVFLEDVSRKVSGTCDCDRRDEPDETSRFKTAAEVRAGLRALGYR